MSENMWNVVKNKLTKDSTSSLRGNTLPELEADETNGNGFEDKLGMFNFSADYQLPENLNKRLIEQANNMQLDSCDLLQLIIELALVNKKDVRVAFLENEKANLEKYFSDKTEIELEDTFIFYDRVEINLDVDVDSNKFNLIIMFLQGDNYVAKKIIKPIENYLG